MPKLKAVLSTESIAALLKELNDYSVKVEALPARITETLVSECEREIRENLSSVTDVDGNYLAEAGSSVSGNRGIAYMEGDQAQYLEYGTGEAGNGSPHPLADDVGWNYDSGNRIRKIETGINKGKRMWLYFDKIKNHPRRTNGLPAQMPVLKAAVRLRGRVREVAEEALK